MSSSPPIYISLNGDLYTDKNKSMVGTICGDHRLITLEAFLDSLANTTQTAKEDGNYSLALALKNMVEKCPADILQSRDIVLEITSTVDQKNKALTHKFRVSAQERK